MRKVRAAAVHFGIGSAGFYLVFLVPLIANNFSGEFLLILRQTLSMIFGVCVFTNLRGLLDEGEKLAPRVLSIANVILDILNIILKRNKDEK